jgi:hypothetical protein
VPTAVTPPSGSPRPRLTFLGTGYLGATYAICFAELGYDVLGFDVDQPKIAKLSAGEVPFHEPGLDELLRRNLAAGRLRFTTDYKEVAEFGDIHFICVGTPQRHDGMGADLTYVESAVTNLVPHLTRKALIVGKSTVPVGTAEWIEQLVSKHAPGELDIEVAWSPEFLQEGVAVEDVLRPNRVIFGVKSQWAHSMLYAAHKGVFDLAVNEDREVPVVVTDFATAELVKVAANAFLATKISFINAMAEVCEAAGADVTLLARSMGYDPADRQQVPPRRHRLRRRLPAQGHPLLPGSRPGAGRRRGAALPARGGPHQRAPSRPGGPARRRPARPPLRPGRAGPRRASTSPCSARPSSQTPMTYGIRPRSRWPASSPAPAPRSPSSTRRAWRTRSGTCPR